LVLLRGFKQELGIGKAGELIIVWILVQTTVFLAVFRKLLWQWLAWARWGRTVVC